MRNPKLAKERSISCLFFRFVDLDTSHHHHPTRQSLSRNQSFALQPQHDPRHHIRRIRFLHDRLSFGRDICTVPFVCIHIYGFMTSRFGGMDTSDQRLGVARFFLTAWSKMLPRTNDFSVGSMRFLRSTFGV